METYRDNEIAVWLCRHGSSADVVEFPLEERPPIDQACASHGEELIRKCPNKKCPAATYHPSDLERRYHHCGERIPWAESRAETARAMMEHDPFNSRFVGRPKPQRGVIESMLDTTFRGSGQKQREPTPRERQDLIVPPSGGLPKVALPDAEPIAPGNQVRDMSEFIDWEGTKELGKLRRKWDENANKPPRKTRFVRARQGLGHIGRFGYLVLVGVVTGLILLVVGIYLYNQGVRGL